MNFPPVPDRAAVSPSELAAALGVSLATVKRWLRMGKVKSARIGRRVFISRVALEQALGSDVAASVFAALKANTPPNVL